MRIGQVALAGFSPHLICFWSDIGMPIFLGCYAFSASVFFFYDFLALAFRLIFLKLSSGRLAPGLSNNKVYR